MHNAKIQNGCEIALISMYSAHIQAQTHVGATSAHSEYAKEQQKILIEPESTTPP